MLKKSWRRILIFLTLFAGFTVRVYLVDKVIVGDILAYVDWGQKLWVWGTKDYYWGQVPWYYSPPNYPPIAALAFAGIDWLFRHKYWLAELHNLIKIPPAAFIVYFYKYGDIFLYKLPSILADLGLGVVVYKLIFGFTRNFSKAFFGLVLFVFNPATIFISGAWGQTDSLVAIFGLLSFICLAKGKFPPAAFLFFVSMYIKPSWGVFGPFFIYLTYLQKPKMVSLVLGVVLVIAAAFTVSAPFAANGVLVFTKSMWIDKYIIPVKSVGKASVSAFNFHTIFMRVDRDLFNAKYLNLVSADKLGLIFFLAVNVFAFSYARKAKDFLWGTVVGVFTIGIGSFLFMANMLERYFFPGFAPLVIIMLTDLKTFLYGIIMNVIFFANIIWSFYRRGSDEIDHPFTNNNFALIRTLSLFIVSSWLIIVSLLKKAVPRATI